MAIVVDKHPEQQSSSRTYATGGVILAPNSAAGFRRTPAAPRRSHFFKSDGLGEHAADDSQGDEGMARPRCGGTSAWSRSESSGPAWVPRSERRCECRLSRQTPARCIGSAPFADSFWCAPFRREARLHLRRFARSHSLPAGAQPKSATATQKASSRPDVWRLFGHVAVGKRQGHWIRSQRVFRQARKAI